jgi:hypothetical protein
MAKKPKLTPAQIRNHIKKIEDIIEKQKREHEYRGEVFKSPTREEIEKKLKRVNSPFLIGEGWLTHAPPGGTIPYFLNIYNPDATQADNLFAHVWVGSGNADPTLGTFLLNVDTRFPRLTQPPDGLTLASGANATLSFDLTVPATVEKTSYMGQSSLIQTRWFDVGQHLERAMFVFAVT